MPDRALVTGAGSGIGRAIAHCLARRGYLVALAGRNSANLNKVAEEINHNGGQAAPVCVDLSQPDQVASLVPDVQSLLSGKIDLLVNNAGINPFGQYQHILPEIIEQAVQVNLYAPLVLTRMILPGLLDTVQQSAQPLHPIKKGIILIASQTSMMPLPYNAIYSATKAGLDSFASALRLELSNSGIHLTTAYPPPTATLMTQSIYDNFLKSNTWAKHFTLADPLKVGERIITSFQKGVSEVHWLDYGSVLALLHRFAPGVSRYLLKTQLKFLEKIFTSFSQEMNNQ